MWIIGDTIQTQNGRGKAISINDTGAIFQFPDGSMKSMPHIRQEKISTNKKMKTIKIKEPKEPKEPKTPKTPKVDKEQKEIDKLDILIKQAKEKLASLQS